MLPSSAALEFQRLCEDSPRFCGSSLRFCGDLLRFCKDLPRFCGVHRRFAEIRRRFEGLGNANLGAPKCAQKYELGGVHFIFFTVNTAKYSPKFPVFVNTGRISRPYRFAEIQRRFFGGDPAPFCGNSAPFCGDPAPFCEDSPPFCGDSRPVFRAGKCEFGGAGAPKYRYRFWGVYFAFLWHHFEI